MMEPFLLLYTAYPHFVHFFTYADLYGRDIILFDVFVLSNGSFAL